VDPVGVLIVNFNGAARTAACLAALERQTVPRHRFEVIVVDNASADGSTATLPARFPWVRFVPLRRNVGFAEGNNVAARHAHGSRLVLLNNDTVPDPFWLEELLRAWDVRPGAAVASKLVFDADPRSVNSAGLFLLRDGRGLDAGYRQTDDGRYEAGGPVFGGCGAAVTTRRRADGTVLEPWFFVYYEDLDAFWADQLAGRPARLAPRSLVRHVHGAAAGDGSAVFRYHVERNRAVAALRNADPFLAVWSGLTLAAKVPQAIARAAVGRLPMANALAVVRALAAYLRRLPVTLAERHAVRGAGRCGW
jgi:GT2 family glycosyltransferase